MTPEIDHASAADIAKSVIEWCAKMDGTYDYEACVADSLAVSRAYLARSEELATLEKAYNAACEEVVDLERRAKNDAKHLEATSARATENYNALAAENARLREALERLKKAVAPFVAIADPPRPEYGYTSADVYWADPRKRKDAHYPFTQQDLNNLRAEVRREAV